MSTYRSPVTSWRISACGNSGARSSGPTGWPVPGCSGGGGGAGRSGITLYHWVGRSDSSSRYFVLSAMVASRVNAVPVETAPNLALAEGRRVVEAAARYGQISPLSQIPARRRPPPNPGGYGPFQPYACQAPNGGVGGNLWIGCLVVDGRLDRGGVAGLSG